MPTTKTPARLIEDLPAAVLQAVRCPACGEGLHRAETGWVCPVGLDHTGLVGDGLMLERLTAAVAAGSPRRPPKGVAKRAWLGRWWAKPANVLRVLKALSRRRLIPRAGGGQRRQPTVKGA